MDGDHNLDCILEQGVAVVGLDFGDGIAIIFQALDDNLSGLAAGSCRHKLSRIGLIGHMAGNIIDALGFVQLRDNPIIIGIVVHHKLDVCEITQLIGELLRQVKTVGVNVRVIVEGVIVVGIGALPRQDNFVGIAVIAVNHIRIGIDGAGVGDANGTIGIATVEAGAVIDCGGIVDLVQAGGGHSDGHCGCIVSGGAVGDGELAIRFCPGCNQIGAGRILEPLQFDIVLVVFNAFGERIDEGVGGQCGRIGSDAGQRGDDLIVHNIAVRTSAGVGVAIADVIGCAVVLAGVGSAFTKGLFQIGSVRLILRVDGQIVVPVSAVNGRGRQRDEEGCGGVEHIFGNVGFHQQIQSEIEVHGRRMTVRIGFGHIHAALISHKLFQIILDSGGILVQLCGKGVDQHITDEIEGATFGAVSVAFGQSEGVQKLRSFCAASKTVTE